MQAKTRLLKKIVQIFPKKLIFKFMLSDNSQKNGVVEQGFDNIYPQMRAIMAHTGIHKNPNTILWPEWTATMTKLENVMVNPHKENVPTRGSTIRFQTTQNT